MPGKGLRVAVSRWSSGTSRVRTTFHLIIGGKLVVRKLMAFAVMVALVLSMAGCKGIEIG
jgi:hypothetical protein